MKEIVKIYNTARHQWAVPFVSRKEITEDGFPETAVMFSDELLNDNKVILCRANIFALNKYSSNEFAPEEKIAFYSLEALLKEWRVD